MLCTRMNFPRFATLWMSCAAAATLSVAACSSDDSSPAAPPPDAASQTDSTSSAPETGGGDVAAATNDANLDANSGANLDASADGDATLAAATCASPGMPTAGPADTHCALGDGGFMVQTTSQASCMPDVGALPDDGGDTCAYNNTNFGMSSDDDDCKYHVSWTSTPICEGGNGVFFTVTATYTTATGALGAPLTGANTKIESFTTTAGDWDSATYCDTGSTHPGPSGFAPTVEGPPGTYTGAVIFDVPGQWTIRFHFNEMCLDVLPDSPHGHAAYHITVP